jgi:hypothetical protein
MGSLNFLSAITLHSPPPAAVLWRGSVHMADELEAELAMEAEIAVESLEPDEQYLHHLEAAEAAAAAEAEDAVAGWAAEEAEAQADQALMAIIEGLVMATVYPMASDVARVAHTKSTFVRTVPPLQLLAHQVVAENEMREQMELSARLKRERDAELTGLRLAAQAQIAAINAKLEQDLSAARDAHKLHAKQERDRIRSELVARLDHMKPSLDAVGHGWTKCASRDCKELLRPEERTTPEEGCNGATCTMHERYCDECCEYPAWSAEFLQYTSMYIRGHVEGVDEEPYRDLVLCNWCRAYLCPECYRGHETACASMHKGCCGYERVQTYIAANRVHDEVEEVGVVGMAKGHCGRPATEGCTQNENGDYPCGIVICSSCAWICHGYHWSGYDDGDEVQCRTRLCKLHAPAPGKGRKRARYGSYYRAGHSKDADSDDLSEGMCGDCDGELPDREWEHNRRVLYAQSALERAQRARDYEMWM